MRLGAVVPHKEIGTDPGAIRDYAQGVEALGLSHVVIYDHVLGADRDRPGGFVGPYDHETAFHEPLVFLAFVAAVTTTVELITAVLVLPQRQTVLVAKQAAELAILSNNRLRLGVGVGWNEVEFQALNVGFSRRGRRQGEQVELLRRLWTEDSISFDGEFDRVERGGIFPRPSAPIPVWFGGAAPALLARCARLGDGWIPRYGGSPAPEPGGQVPAIEADEESADRIATIRKLRAEVGRSMDEFAILAQAQYTGGTPEIWRSHAAAWRDLGATHLALSTQNSGATDIDGHLARLAEYQGVVGDLS